MANPNPRPPRARKRFGQHFLTDPRALERITQALGPDGTDTVVEIGPGRGALTDRLAARAGRVVAIEIDRDLSALLRERYRDHPHVTIVTADALDEDWAALAGGPYLLAGNVPYNITTPLIFHALRRPRPTRAVLLVQREVADRLLAAPGSKEYGALSVNVQLLAQVDLIGRVPAGAFRPPPKVESSIVRLVPRAPAALADAEEDPFRRFVQRVFGLRRKQIVRVIREACDLDAAHATALLAHVGIMPDVRPETLAPARLLDLYRVVRTGA